MTLSRRNLLFSGAASALVPALPAWAAPKKPNSKKDGSTALAAGESLDALARTKGLRFGTALQAKQLDDPAFVALVKAHCGVIVAENEFKWKQIERKPGKFEFAPADRIAAFAAANKMELRGHTLCWNQDDRNPDWLLKAEPELGADKARLMSNLLADYCKKLITRYPAIRSWDAVNESINAGNGKIRGSVLTRTIGPDFAKVVLEAAREAAPKAQLCYNDYMNWNAKPAHRNGVLRYLEKLVKAGAPLNALGIQSHLANSVRDSDEKEWRRFLDGIQALGLEVIVTELDCSDRDIPEGDVSKRDAETAAHVKAFLDVTLSYPNVRQVLTWSLTDLDSYTRSSFYPADRKRADGKPLRPHPFDDTLKPKPMFEAIRGALAHAPVRTAQTLP